MTEDEIVFNPTYYNFLCKIYTSNFNASKSIVEENLNSIRRYLDSVNYVMPDSKYQYSHDDSRTHKFLDGKISFNPEKVTFNYKNTYNPSFKYGHVV